MNINKSLHVDSLIGSDWPLAGCTKGLFSQCSRYDGVLLYTHLYCAYAERMWPANASAVPHVRSYKQLHTASRRLFALHQFTYLLTHKFIIFATSD